MLIGSINLVAAHTYPHIMHLLASVSEKLPRSIDVSSTAQAFKSWDTCMANKTCKIIAIVGIVLASLLVFWIVATLVQCICMGVACLEALCCCCCRSGNGRYQKSEPNPSPYANPNMYPPNGGPMYRPQHQAPQQAYVPMSHAGYQPVNTYNQYDPGKRVVTDESPFGDNAYRGNKF